MIGHWLLSLTTEQEDRILTTPMRHGGRDTGFDELARCVVQAAFGRDECVTRWETRGQFEAHRDSTVDDWVPARYDDLCAGFGEEHINRAIRARILTNRLWRTLAAGKPSVVAVG